MIAGKHSKSKHVPYLLEIAQKKYDQDKAQYDNDIKKYNEEVEAEKKRLGKVEADRLKAEDLKVAQAKAKYGSYDTKVTALQSQKSSYQSQLEALPVQNSSVNRNIPFEQNASVAIHLRNISKANMDQ